MEVLKGSGEYYYCVCEKRSAMHFVDHRRLHVV